MHNVWLQTFCLTVRLRTARRCASMFNTKPSTNRGIHSVAEFAAPVSYEYVASAVATDYRDDGFINRAAFVLG